MKEDLFYLTMHSTYFIHGYMALVRHEWINEWIMDNRQIEDYNKLMINRQVTDSETEDIDEWKHFTEFWMVIFCFFITVCF